MSLDLMAAVRREGDALLTAARRGPLNVPVPSCSGWDVAALVAHTSRVHHWCTQALQAAGEPAGRFPKPPEGDEALLEWYRRGLDELVAELAARADDEPAWNFAGVEPANVGFWRRRQAQETAVHRWDAEAARGTASPIEAALAADGIAEIMEFFGARRLAAQEGGLDLGGTVHVHCTDTEGEWTFTTRGQTFEATVGHEKGDCALRGPASDLLLVLWGRLAIDDAAVEVFGDRAVAQRWLALGMP